MLNVSEATKSAYKSSSNRVVTITLGQDTYTTSIVQESLSIEEILESNEYLQFTGCNSSKAKFSIFGITNDYKDAPVSISITAYDTNGDPTDTIPLFHGFVDEQITKNFTTSTCEFVCYDILYTLRSVDVAAWYIAIVQSGSNVSVKDFRDSLFEYLSEHYNIDITVEDAELVNDDIEFTKQFSPVQLCALDILKYICQLNGVYGLINRAGNFEYRTLPKINVSDDYEVIEYYKSLDYQRFTALGIGKITVRQTDQVEGVSYGNGTNTYILQGNFFTLNLEDTDLSVIAENVYPQVSDRPYVPFNAEIQGYPWIEVGDIVTYNVYEYANNTFVPMQFYVLRRCLSGIIAIFDSQSAEGDKERSIFTSDVNAQIDTIKDQIEHVQGTLDTMGLKYTMFYNRKAIDIADGDTEPIATTEFAVSRASQVYIATEYLITCETTETETSDSYSLGDLVATMKYEYDGQFLDSRQPKETFTDGKHIFSTWYVVNVPDAQPHTWRVFLGAEGGSIHINILEAQNTILGFDTFVEEMWDGVIRAEDIFEPLTFGGFIGRFTDSASASTQIPTTPSGISDIVSAITFGGFLGSFTDNASVDNIAPPTTGLHKYVIYTTNTNSSTASIVVARYIDGYVIDNTTMTKTNYDGAWENFDNMIRVGFNVGTSNNWTVEILDEIVGYEIGDKINWSYSTTKNITLTEREE